MITINSVTWKIEYVPIDSYLLLRDDGSQAVGVCDDNTKTI